MAILISDWPLIYTHVDILLMRSKWYQSIWLNYHSCIHAETLFTGYLHVCVMFYCLTRHLFWYAVIIKLKKISKQDDLIHDSQLIHTSRNLLIKSNRYLCQLFWFLTDLYIIYVDTLWINYYKKISELYVLISDWPLISASFHQASSSLVVGFRPIRKAASFSSFFDSRPSSFESIR